MPINILVAEDDDMLQRLICDIVRKQGYNPIKAKDGEEALELFFSNSNIAMCILDVMMPIYDGFEVLKEIREHSNVKVMMLTALTDERNEIQGFNKGADDYICKPFSYPVLVARIESLLKDIKAEQTQVIKEGDLSIDKNKREVLVCEESIELTNKEYNLLIYLVENRNIVLTREKILNEIWGFDYDGDSRTIDAHIKTLRKKLQNCDFIKTVRNVGYKFDIII